MVVLNVLIISMFVLFALQGKLLLSAFITLAATAGLISLYLRAKKIMIKAQKKSTIHPTFPSLQ
ncbi:MAG: hypothetical protein LRY71_13800 [Bacillaceae bacterium]|nr:hypothetical protein [Bacillaceae bacterium]